jgi:hypothetical protein
LSPLLSTKLDTPTKGLFDSPECTSSADRRVSISLKIFKLKMLCSIMRKKAGLGLFFGSRVLIDVRDDPRLGTPRLLPR